MKVCKFGGTSMANASTINKVVDIVESDLSRKYIVVSAPGKRTPQDVKVTDALYACFSEVKQKGNCDSTFKTVEKRFREIVEGLNVDIELEENLQIIKKGIEESTTPDYAASRGEYLSAKILAAKLGYEFVDAYDIIKFNDKGELLLDYSLDRVKAKLSTLHYAVIPGFYGSDSKGKVHTFSRGGSDISGAIVARAMHVDIYENWTDVDGFLTADPRIVEKPTTINCLSYKELRELSYMGAEVMHPESIFPVHSIGLPINIKNTFNPSHPGTMIVKKVDQTDGNNIVTGISGKKGMTIINIEKDMMNSEVGFVRRVLSILEYEGISFEHLPSGIDTMSLVIRDEFLNGKMQKILQKIKEDINPDNLEIHSGLSLVAIVGHNMASRLGTAATVFSALAGAHINIRMIDQGSSELNIIVGVDTCDYEKAINAIYYAFQKEQ